MSNIVHFQGNAPFNVTLQGSEQPPQEAICTVLDQQWHASLVIPGGEACTIEIEISPAEARPRTLPADTIGVLVHRTRDERI